MTEWLHFHFSLSCITEGNGNPLQCSCLENPRDEGAWWAAIYRIAQGRTRLKRLSSSSSRLPCPWLSPRVCSNSCPLSQWCHPTISSSVTRFCCPQSFSALGSFPMSQLFSFGISLSSEDLGLISFRIDWFYLLAVLGALKSLLQYHNSKASILQRSVFFMVQLSHP